MKNTITIVFLIFAAIHLSAQNQQDKKPAPALWQFLKKGEINGQVRSFYSMTINKDALTDYHTLGLGLGLRYETPTFKGFQLGIGGSAVFNLASTPLDIPDSLSKQYNRYEMGLFDVTNPSERWNLPRLEELYLKYTFRKSTAVLGRQLLNTPFINPQDGRLRPTYAEGIWLSINEVKGLKINAGYLWGVAPRSTVRWYDIASSMGLYPVGRNADGTGSGYKNNLKSAGVVLIGAEYKNSWFSVQVWDQFVENIFNTVLVQADFTPALDTAKKTQLTIGIQGIAQQVIANGGNSDISKTYFNPNQPAWVIGGQIGAKIYDLTFNFNYNYIFDTGRFLMPREWGKEPLYTFIPRERTEGTGNVHGITTNWIYNFKKIGLKTQLSYGYYLRPDAKDAALNKYAMGSYGHFQVMIDKTFSKYLKGLHFKIIYMYKHAASETYNNPNFIFNKVDMHHLNFIVNYVF